MHDSSQADYGVYDDLGLIYDKFGATVVVDSAFTKAEHDFLIRSSQQDPETEEDILVNKDATSIRQLSEWGM